MRNLVAKRLIGGFHDLAMAAIALPLAFFLRVGQPPELTGTFLLVHGFFVATAVICFVAYGLNQGSWRYASIEDMLAIVQSAALATLATFVASFMLNRLEGMPRSVFPLTAGTLILLMAGPRVLFRAYKQRHNRRREAARSEGAESILIYGFCDEAANFIRAMQRQRGAKYIVRGIIDHNNRNSGRQLHQVPVIGGIEDVQKFMKDARVSRDAPTKLVVAVPNVEQALMERLVVAASEAALTVFRLPIVTDLKAYDTVEASQPLPIRLEDLLGRPHVNLDMAIVARMVRGKKVLVTGAGGSIGSELTRQLAAFSPRRLTMVDNSEFLLYSIERNISETVQQLEFSPVLCDVRDQSAISSIIRREKPDIIFHAAALKHVPLVESNVLEGIKTNAFGTRNVADAALASGCEVFVLISTDKAVNPTNVMGATKRCAETYCQNLDQASETTRFITVRFGNVLGSAGSVVPLFSSQIAKGGPVTVTHPDIERYFMTIPEAVRLVLSAAANGFDEKESRGKIFVLEMGKPVKIVNLAERMIQLSGKRPHTDIEIKFTGLRPGEKLFEEIFETSEQLAETKNKWLLVAAPRVVEAKRLAEAFSRMHAAIGSEDVIAALSAIQLIVPEFKRELAVADGDASLTLKTSTPDPIRIDKIRHRTQSV